jgi:hypothetical protein
MIQQSQIGSIMRSLDAARNKQVIGLYSLTAVVMGVCFFLGFRMGISTGSWALAALFMVAGLLVYVIGYNAGGFMLMDTAKGYEQRSIADALVSGVMMVPKLLVAFLIQILILVALAIVIAVLALICKIPGIGAFLYTFVLPTSVVISGLILFGFMYAVAVLLLPSFWDGLGVMQAFARVWAVTTQRFLSTFINVVLLGLLVIVAGLLIFGILLSGTTFATMTTGAIIASGGGMNDISNIMMMLMQAGGAADYMLAGGIGLGVLYLVAFMVPLAISVYGLCNIYLGACDGLDFSGAEQGLHGALSQAKQKMDDAQQRAKKIQSERMSPAKKAGMTCPKCSSDITADDLFCGECGHKLK